MRLCLAGASPGLGPITASCFFPLSAHRSPLSKKRQLSPTLGLREQCVDSREFDSAHGKAGRRRGCGCAWLPWARVGRNGPRADAPRPLTRAYRASATDRAGAGDTRGQGQPSSSPTTIRPAGESFLEAGALALSLTHHSVEALVTGGSWLQSPHRRPGSHTLVPAVQRGTRSPGRGWATPPNKALRSAGACKVPGCGRRSPYTRLHACNAAQFLRCAKGLGLQDPSPRPHRVSGGGWSSGETQG